MNQSIVEVHRLVALLAGAVAIVLAVIGAASTRLPHPGRLAVDRLILGVVAVLAVSWLTGGLLLVLGGHPADPLHFLYAGLAILVLPVARLWDALGRRRMLAVAVGAAVAFVLVVRLFQTG